MALYREIAGHPYTLEREATVFDVAAAVSRPFPFSTISARTVGEQFMAIGFLIKQMNLPAHASILEFGPGWGNTTLALAQMGHHVTAVDIEPRFCELIEERARRLDVPVRVINSSFSWSEQADSKFDAVLFFECFHHSDNHLRLLTVLHDVLKPGGRVFFGGEPIDPGFPQPWGLRLDGQSLWSTRKFGWMELGFSETYFRQALAQTGWRGTRTSSQDLPWMTVWEARKPDEPVVFLAADERIKTEFGWKKPEGLHLSGKRGRGMYGPYVAVGSGHLKANVWFRGPVSGAAKLDIVSNGGNTVLAERDFTGKDIGSMEHISVSAFLKEQVTDLEVRLFCFRGFSCVVDRIELI